MKNVIKIVPLILLMTTIIIGNSNAQWENLPGKAEAIAAGGDSAGTAVWTIGQNNAAYKWDESAFSWQSYGGKATKIAVDSDGIPWVVNDQKVYRLRGQTWQNMPGKAVEIAAGGGNVFVIGDSKAVYQWNDDAFSWQSVGGKADLIGVDSEGIPWVVNDKKIYRLRGQTWQNMPGKAVAIDAGGGTVWTIGESGAVYKWNDQGFTWESKGGKATQIAVGPDGVPYVVNDQKVYRYRGN